MKLYEDESFLEAIKRHLNITWDDEDTDKKIRDMIADTQVQLDHLLGAKVDYSHPGAGRDLFKSFCLYKWNNIGDEFESSYQKDINRLRRFLRIEETINHEEE